MPGLTRVTDRQNIFKKNAQFSKPIQESLDFVELWDTIIISIKESLNENVYLLCQFKYLIRKVCFSS